VSFQRTNYAVDNGPAATNGLTLVGLRMKSTYTFLPSVTTAAAVSAYESDGDRVTGSASSVLLTSGVRLVDLVDTTESTATEATSGTLWCLPGATDADRIVLGFADDAAVAGAPITPTYPDGLWTEEVENLADTTVAGVSSTPGDGVTPRDYPASDLIDALVAAGLPVGGAGGDADAAPVACPPGVITPVVVSAGVITAHKYVFREVVDEDVPNPLLALPPAADHIGEVITQMFEVGSMTGPVVEVIPPDPNRKPSLDFTAWLAALTTTDFGGGDSVDFDLDGGTVTATFTGVMTAGDIISALLTPLVTAGATYYLVGAILFVSSPTEGGSISITDPGAVLDFGMVDVYGLGGFVRAIDETGGGLDADLFYGPGTDNPDYEFVGEGFGTHSSPTGGSLIQRGVQLVAIPDRRAWSGARWTAVDWPIRSEFVPYSLAAPGGTDYCSNLHTELDKLLDFQSDAPGTYAYQVDLVDVDGVNVPTISLTTPGALFDAKGDLPVGTGADTAAKLTVGTNGQVLTADSAEPTGLKWATVAGTGDVVGPASAVDSHVALFDGTTGKLLKDGGALGDAAAKNTGTTAGTLAAGDDSRITGAAQKASNLSDLASTATALTNLGAQPVDSDLTAIAGLSPSNDDILQRKSGAWANRTLAQVMADVMPLMAGSTALSVFAAPSASVGTYAPTAGSNAVYLISSSTAVNDYIEWAYFPLAAGTYTVSLTHMTGTGNGQLRISIDGSNIGGGVIESYAASTAAAREVITGVSVASSGLHTVRITTPSKNASSSAYVMRLVDLAFARTA